MPGDIRAPLVAQSVKNPPATQETQVCPLGLEDPLGEGKGDPLQYSCLRNPMDRGVWQATVHRVTRVGHDLATKPPPPTQKSYTNIHLAGKVSEGWISLASECLHSEPRGPILP